MSEVAPPYMARLLTCFFHGCIAWQRNQNLPYVNVKLVNSPPKKFQRILSHGSQLEGKKHLWFLSMTSLKGGYQFYRNPRTFSRLHRIEAWNDIMKVTRLETLFINVNKKFKKLGVRFILVVSLTLLFDRLRLVRSHPAVRSRPTSLVFMFRKILSLNHEKILILLITIPIMNFNLLGMKSLMIAHQT